MKKLNELQNLKGKIALVTGGAGYLGAAICETLAELGAEVIVASRDKNKCENFARLLQNKYEVKCVGLRVDITNQSSLDEIMNYIKDNHGKLDILVNDAWSGNKNTFESISNEDWMNDVNVCLNGPFYTIKSAYSLLKASKGVILNVSSMYGLIAPDYRMYDGKKYANPPSYGAAKAGIIQLTKYLASFLSPQGIRVNSISPGAFPFENTVKENPEFGERLAAKTILGRIGYPEDLKGVIAFLCTNASAYVTGQNISVDGGWTTW